MAVPSERNNDTLLMAWVRDFFEDTPDMLFVKDRELVYIGASKAFSALTVKKTPERVVGCTDM